MLFPRNLVPALWPCHIQVIQGFYACRFVLYFPFLKQFSIWLLAKNMRVCVYPSVYDALKYFTETVTPRIFFLN